MGDKIIKSETEWKKTLSPEQYEILRQKGTEQAFTGKYYASKEKGMYLCAACGNELFSSDKKFDSGTGWPSFDAPVSGKNVNAKPDESHGMFRTEVTCNKCGSHLGHVFNDGPTKTGERYCINSACLLLKEDADKR